MGHERSYNVTDHCAKIEKEMETFLKVNEEQVEYFAKKAKGKVKRPSTEGGGRRIFRPKSSQPRKEQIQNYENSKEETRNVSFPEPGSVSRIPEEPGTKFSMQILKFESCEEAKSDFKDYPNCDEINDKKDEIRYSLEIPQRGWM